MSSRTNEFQSLLVLPFLPATLNPGASRVSCAIAAGQKPAAVALLLTTVVWTAHPLSYDCTLVSGCSRTCASPSPGCRFSGKL